MAIIKNKYYLLNVTAIRYLNKKFSFSIKYAID